jgi:hypothetical protein
MAFATRMPGSFFASGHDRSLIAGPNSRLLRLKEPQVRSRSIRLKKGGSDQRQ